MRVSTWLTVIATTAISTTALAQSANSGLYGELGYVSMDYKEPTTSLTLGALRAFVGFDASENLALEGMLGVGANSGSGTVLNVPYSIKISSMFGFYAKAKAKLTPELEVFGRLGSASITRNLDVMNVSDSSSGGSLSYGIGLAYQLAPKTSITADYMSYYNKDDIKFQGASVGVKYRF